MESAGLVEVSVENSMPIDMLTDVVLRHSPHRLRHSVDRASNHHERRAPQGGQGGYWSRLGRIFGSRVIEPRRTCASA